jgi:hypothetical protein
MDKELIQTVFQINQGEIPKRMIVQFKEETEKNQTVNFYEDLTDEQKAVFDAFEELSKSLMV